MTKPTIMPIGIINQSTGDSAIFTLTRPGVPERELVRVPGGFGYNTLVRDVKGWEVPQGCPSAWEIP